MEKEDNQQDFVDPKEIQRTLKEIANMRSEIKRVITQNKKTASASDITELNAILAEANKSYTAIKSADASEVRSVMQDFFDGQYWEKIQAVRTRLEIPKELKQMAPIFKRLEKTLSTKAIQSIGLDIEKAKLGVAEMKQLADRVQTAYNAGDMETAQEAMQELRDNGGHPGEIEGTIFRFRDIKNLLKKVKDAQVRTEVDGVLQEVVDAFNSGDYRQANQAMNEYTDDLQKLINTFIKSKINNKNRTDSMNKIQNLETLIQSKLGTEAQQQTQTAQPTQTTVPQQ
jgi:soluble cytochrome b562